MMRRKWTGSIFDLGAKEARVELEIPDQVVKANDLKVSGEGKLRVFFEGNFEKSDSKAPLSIRKPDFKAPLSITIEGEKVHLTYKAGTKLGADTESARISFEFNGEITDADPFAKKAIFGSYHPIITRRSAFFKGGNMIIWLFAGAEKIEA